MDNKSSISIGKHPPSKKPLPPTPGSTQTSPLTTTITSTTISSNSNSNSNSTVSSLDMDSPPAPRLPPKPMREQAKVLFAYDAQNDDELTIKEGDIITIISKEVEDQGWWKGELSGRIGVFPDNFVELIKVPVVSSGSGNTMTSSGSGNNNNLSVSGDDLSTHALRLKKPERPSEKPPPSASSAILAGSSPPMSSSIKNSLEEIMLNKSQGVNHPCLPGKKPKSSSLLSKSVVVKPDVVPVESHDSTGGQCNAYENGTSENCENNSVDGGLTGLDSSSNKLTHLTAKRAKGPKDRRPPSMLGVPKEFENGFGKENGSGHSPHHHHGGSTGDLTSTGHRKSSPPPAVGSATGSTPPNQQQQVPWVLELKKTQEKKNEEKRKATIVGGGGTCNLEDSPSNTIKAFGTPNSPTKTSPNRFSGDFTSKFGGSIIHGSKDTSASLPSDHVVDQTTPTSINAPAPYKPAKAVKPVATALGSNNTKVLPSTPIGKSQLIQSTSVVDNTNTTPSSSSVGNSNSSINHVNKEVIELQNELRTLKETMVSKVDFEDLLKQCNELKELVESQKQSYGSVIKDLINDVADTRKKIATLQIEVDRLRRLTTTV